MNVKKDFESYCEALGHFCVSDNNNNLRDFTSFVVNHLQTVFEETELSKNLTFEEQSAVRKSIRIWTAAAVSQ